MLRSLTVAIASRPRGTADMGAGNLAVAGTCAAGLNILWPAGGGGTNVL